MVQANQEKLSRMLGSINAMFLMCFRLSKLHEAGKMSHADASMVKAWTTLRGMPAFCFLCTVFQAHSACFGVALLHLLSTLSYLVAAAAAAYMLDFICYRLQVQMSRRCWPLSQ